MVTRRNQAHTVLSANHECNPHEVEQSAVDTHEAILRYLPFLHFIAKKVRAGHEDGVCEDELVSSGIIGLVEAMGRYDAKRGVKFTTFAYSRIKGAMIEELRATDWFPRSLRDKARKIERANQHLSLLLGRQPTDQEMADELQMKPSAYLGQAREVNNLHIASIDEIEEMVDPGSDGVGAQRSEWPCRSAESHAEEGEELAAIAKRVSTMSYRERRILELYYYADMSVKDIAVEIGVTPSRISQILHKCLENLRAYFSEG